MSERHTCTHCGEPITTDQRWEYTRGGVGDEGRDAAPRIHSACVAVLLRKAIAALARVPEHQRETFTFEI